MRSKNTIAVSFLISFIVLSFIVVGFNIPEIMAQNTKLNPGDLPDEYASSVSISLEFYGQNDPYIVNSVTIAGIKQISARTGQVDPRQRDSALPTLSEIVLELLPRDMGRNNGFLWNAFYDSSHVILSTATINYRDADQGTEFLRIELQDVWIGSFVRLH